MVYIMNIITRAIHFAAVKHANQRRKDINHTPYINHPIELSNFLCNTGQINDPIILCAAILHDTLEDTNTTYDELVEEFGEQISNIVLECTDEKSLDKITRKRLQVEHAYDCSDNAKLVKLADKWSNVKSLLESPPTEWSTDRLLGYVRWSYACCIQMYGVNDNIDRKLQNLFNQWNVRNVTQEELEQYYELL